MGTDTLIKVASTKADEYYVPVDPMDDLQCEGCQ